MPLNMRSNREIYTLWWNIIDIIGPSQKWPKSVRKLFWKKDWNHEQRFKVALFIYINGVNPLILFEWIHVYGNITSKAGWCHLKYLIELFEEGIRYRNKYWSFNVALGRYQYLNGNTRYYH